MRERLKSDPAPDIAGADFIRELHRRFVSQLPDALRVVRGDNGETARNVPGELRQRDVKVGALVPPAPDQLPALLAAFSEAWKGLPKTPAHILLAHHRFAWIHPFLDGNGRIARLLSTAMLARHRLDADGLWSLSRGLAKRKDRLLRAVGACGRRASRRPRRPRLERGAAGRLLGLSERAARKVVSECVEDGLLTAKSSRADLTPVYPVYAAAYLFPHLFEIDDPQAAMRETLLKQ